MKSFLSDPFEDTFGRGVLALELKYPKLLWATGHRRLFVKVEG